MKTLSTKPSAVGIMRLVAKTGRSMAISGAFAGLVLVLVPTQARAQMPSVSAALPSSSGNASGVQNGLFTHGGEAIRVVDTAGFRTAADIGSTAAGTVAQIGHQACGSCGTSCGGSCGGSTLSMGSMSMGSCNSCGTRCGGACGSRRSPLTCGNNYMDPCNPCDPYRYVLVEGLFMQPEENSFSLSPNFGMDGFDREFAMRVTIGQVGDCVHGCEASFVGPFSWDMSGQLSSAGGGITSFLNSGNPPAVLSSFDNAVFQSQQYDAEFWSLEANKTLVGWEMAKLLVGGRYINYDEDFTYFSRTAASGDGVLRSSADNQLFGGQVGLDLLYPISRNGFTDLRARAGAFYNSADSDVRVINNGTTVAAGNDDAGELAGFFEFGSGVRYQLGEILSVRAGVELWYLSGVASAPDQFRNAVGPTTGRSVRVDDDVLFTGLSFGAELRY